RVAPIWATRQTATAGSQAGGGAPDVPERGMWIQSRKTKRRTPAARKSPPVACIHPQAVWTTEDVPWALMNEPNAKIPATAARPVAMSAMRAINKRKRRRRSPRTRRMDLISLGVLPILTRKETPVLYLIPPRAATILAPYTVSLPATTSRVPHSEHLAGRILIPLVAPRARAHGWPDNERQRECLSVDRPRSRGNGRSRDRASRLQRVSHCRDRRVGGRARSVPRSAA